MSSVAVPQRRLFWQNFNIQYHATHPGLRHMKNMLWEPPHSMHWLAGVLIHHEYADIDALEFYISATALSGINQRQVRCTLMNHVSDVYLLSPMTPNLPFADEIADH
jgi:anaerobic magnesium-protoporphyrin IX monomethyl ester cyclase